MMHLHACDDAVTLSAHDMLAATDAEPPCTSRAMRRARMSRLHASSEIWAGPESCALMSLVSTGTIQELGTPLHRRRRSSLRREATAHRYSCARERILRLEWAGPAPSGRLAASCQTWWPARIAFIFSNTVLPRGPLPPVDRLSAGIDSMVAMRTDYSAGTVAPLSFEGAQANTLRDPALEHHIEDHDGRNHQHKGRELACAIDHLLALEQR